MILSPALVAASLLHTPEASHSIGLRLDYSTNFHSRVDFTDLRETYHWTKPLRILQLGISYRGNITNQLSLVVLLPSPVDVKPNTNTDEHGWHYRYTPGELYDNPAYQANIRLFNPVASLQFKWHVTPQLYQYSGIGLSYIHAKGTDKVSSTDPSLLALVGTMAELVKYKKGLVPAFQFGFIYEHTPKVSFDLFYNITLFSIKNRREVVVPPKDESPQRQPEKSSISYLVRTPVSLSLSVNYGF
jgi:hypothetical protein